MNSCNIIRVPHFQLILTFAIALVACFIVFDVSNMWVLDRHSVSAFKPTALGNQSAIGTNQNNSLSGMTNQPLSDRNSIQFLQKWGPAYGTL